MKVKRIARKIKEIATGLALGVVTSPVFSFANGTVGTNTSTTGILKAIIIVIGGIIAIVGLVMVIPATFRYIMAHRANDGTAQADASKDLAVGIGVLGFGAALALGASPIISALGI